MNINISQLDENDLFPYFRKKFVFSFAYVLPEIIEEGGVMTYPAAHHQWVVLKMFWLYFWGTLMSSIFTYIPRHVYVSVYLLNTFVIYCTDVPVVIQSGSSQ